jgi:hypothetical protein
MIDCLLPVLPLLQASAGTADVILKETGIRSLYTYKPDTLTHTRTLLHTHTLSLALSSPLFAMTTPFHMPFQRPGNYHIQTMANLQ